MISVTIYNEYLHELKKPQVQSIYTKGIHGAATPFYGNAKPLETIQLKN